MHFLLLCSHFLYSYLVFVSFLVMSLSPLTKFLATGKFSRNEAHPTCTHCSGLCVIGNDNHSDYMGTKVKRSPLYVVLDVFDLVSFQCWVSMYVSGRLQ